MPFFTHVGPPPPDIPGLLPTFDSDFSRGESVLTEGQWPLRGYPWLYNAKGGTSPNPGTVPTELRDDNGGWSAVAQIPIGIGAQTVINSEGQYYCRDYELTEFGEPPLTRVVDGVLQVEARRTPDSMLDRARCDFGFNFRSQNVDEAARTFQVKGERYKPKVPSSNGHYLWDREHVGVERYLRDELIGDTELFQETKYRQYPYTWVRLHSDVGGIYRYVRIDQIIDPSGDNDPIAAYDASGWIDPVAMHTLRIMDGELTPAEWEFFRQGATIKMVRHLPWISQMLDTGGGFSQRFGMWEFDMQLPDHRDNFVALWGWANAREMFNVPGFPTHNFAQRWGNATEVDYTEWPGGGAVYNKHHNMHAARLTENRDGEFDVFDAVLPKDANGNYTMEDYAAFNGLDPVVAHPEWARSVQHGTQIAVPIGGEGYVDYGQRHTLRVYHHGPNAADYGKIPNTVEWYTKQGAADGPGEFRRVAGCHAPPWWADDPGAPKRLFVNMAVLGDFVTNSRHSYTKGQGSTLTGDSMMLQLWSAKCYQMPGLEAGGGGFPDETGYHSRGMLPTPNDPTGNSGSGIVPGGGTTTPVDPNPDPDPDPTVTPPSTPAVSGLKVSLRRDKSTRLDADEADESLIHLSGWQTITVNTQLNTGGRYIVSGNVRVVLPTDGNCFDLLVVSGAATIEGTVDGIVDPVVNAGSARSHVLVGTEWRTVSWN